MVSTQGPEIVIAEHGWTLPKVGHFTARCTMKALLALHASAEKGGLPPRTQLLVILRPSQINGCSVCVDMYSRELKKSPAIRDDQEA